MELIKKFLSSKYSFLLALVVGLAFSMGVSVLATSIGTAVTVTGTLTASGAATVATTLAVTGATTLSSTLAVTGATTQTGLLTAVAGYVSQASSTVVGDFHAEGAVSASSSVSIAGPLSIGSTTPKAILNISGGTCNLSTGETNSGVAVSGGDPGTFAASTTKMHFCAATGVRPGDQVFVTLPSGVEGQASSSPLAGTGLVGSIHLAGAYATTSNIIGVALYNALGVATGSYTQATTGVRYLIFR